MDALTAEIHRQRQAAETEQLLEAQRRNTIQGFHLGVIKDLYVEHASPVMMEGDLDRLAAGCKRAADRLMLSLGFLQPSPQQTETPPVAEAACEEGGAGG